MVNYVISTAVPQGHLLLLTVNCSLSSLTSFPCTAKGDNLQIFFTVNPSQALQQLLEGASKTSVVMTPVQLGSAKKVSGKVQNGPQQMSSNIQTPDKVEDVSVSPIDPLGTPVVVSLSLQLAFKTFSLQNSSTGSVCTPPDQSIPAKTPRTSTPSLKTTVSNHINKNDKKVEHSDILTTGSKGGIDQRKRKALTLSTKKTDQQSQHGRSNNDQNGKRLSNQTNTKDDFDYACAAHNKKSVLPMKVTENNIDNFLNQLNTKPKPVTKKYTTRSSVKQSTQVPNDKQQSKSKGQENVTHQKQSRSVINKISGMQKSYQPTSPVVKLQQIKRSRVTEAPSVSAIRLSAFNFDDDESQPVSKKPCQVDSSINSSSNSSLEMSQLNASLLARGNTSKSFSMTPQKKARNAKSKKQPSIKKPVSI